MIPGHTAFTRIPSGPSSCAIAHVNAWMRRLRRRVGRGARRHHLPADRRDVDDAAAVALLDEMPAERAAHVEGAVEVDVDHACATHRRSRSTTGTRSWPRAAPALLTTMSTRPSSSTTRWRERVDRRRVGHVAHHGQRSTAERADLVGDRRRCRANRLPSRRRGSGRADGRCRSAPRRIPRAPARPRSAGRWSACGRRR